MRLSPDRKKLLSWDDAEGLAVVPEGVEEIGNGAFYHASLLRGVSLPCTIKRIGNSAFDGCTSLKKISLPQSVEYIGEGAFRYCSSLVGIEIPKLVRRLYKNTFAYCESLLWAKLNSQFEYISFDEYVFYQIPEEFKLVVPYDLLDFYKDSPFKVYNITSKWELPNRSWEECLQEWEDYLTFLKMSENKVSKAILEMIEKGLEPSAMPPIGICLTVDEYNTFVREGRTLKEIYGWCESGKEIHERVRLVCHNCINYDDIIGLETPRKGFYKVIDIDSGYDIKCLYNYRRYAAFSDEAVTIKPKPLYNYASEGPKRYNLRVGDIIEVKEDVQIVECGYDGDFYRAYKIVWGFIDMSERPVSNRNLGYYREDRPSYSQYGGYNGFDDDTINSAFEGDPEATWNVD